MLSAFWVCPQIYTLLLRYMHSTVNFGQEVKLKIEEFLLLSDVAVQCL